MAEDRDENSKIIAPEKPVKESFRKRYSALAGIPLIVLLFELCFALLIGSGLTVYSVLFSLAASGFLTLLIYLFPFRKFRIIAVGAVINTLTIIYIAQYLYYRIFGTIFIWASLQGTNAVIEFSDVVWNAFVHGWWGILIFLLPSVLYWVVGRKAVRRVPVLKRIPLILLAVWIAVASGAVLVTLSDRNGASAGRRLYLTEFSQEPSIRKFGLLPTMVLDFRFNVLKISWSEKTDIDVEDVVIETLPMEETTPAPTATPTPVPPTPEPDATPTPVPPTPTPYGKNVMDIQFDLEEKDKIYQRMNEFFSQRTPTTQNEYTSRFAGKNLILLTAEGFSGFVIDPQLTPTLYKLSTTGFVFSHFYTPYWYVSTSDGEFVETTGLIPKSGIWSYSKVGKNYMPFAFGNQFRGMGYQSNAYHNNTYTYYHRDRSYPAMGYTYKALGNGLNVKKQWPESDTEMIDLSTPDYLNGKPFHTYYMTVSGHLPYAFGDNRMSSNHKDMVKDLEYSSAVRAYIACQIELDQALELLIQRLEEAGELENTVIAFGADHYPYGLTHSQYEELAGKKLSLPFEQYENAFILWCADMEEPVYIDKYCSSLDIAPTLSNLFGLTYDSRLYIGTDILAPEPNWVIFDDKSFINDKIMYDARKNKVTALTDEDISKEYVKECIEYVNDLFWNSAHIIDKDYYGYLFPEGTDWMPRS